MRMHFRHPEERALCATKDLLLREKQILRFAQNDSERFAATKDLLLREKQILRGVYPERSRRAQNDN
jgi:hypothetical protein